MYFFHSRIYLFSYSVLLKLLFSFNWSRWAEKELNMMKLFFDNLVYYIQAVREGRQKHAL